MAFISVCCKEQIELTSDKRVNNICICKKCTRRCGMKLVPDWGLDKKRRKKL